MANGLSFDGTITNTKGGVIDGTANGLYFGEGNHDATVRNYGTIQSDSRAVNIDGTGVTVENYGHIVGTDDQRNGTVYADGTADEYAIVNHEGAVIDGGDGNDSSAISLQVGSEAGDTVRGSVTNFGTIIGRQDSELTDLFVNNPDGLGYGIRLFGPDDVSLSSTTFEGNIANVGLIDADFTGIDIRGVNFTGVAEDGVTGIINTGRIEADLFGIFYTDVDAFDGNIINTGSIIAGGGIIALEDVFLQNRVLTGDIVNFGEISATQTSGIGLSNTNIDGDIVNNGTIEADGTGIFLDGEASLSGEVINTGTITGNVNGDNDEGVAIITTGIGGFTVRNSGTLNGDVRLSEGNDTFIGTDGTVNGKIFGNGGTDVITGGNGRDVIDGGEGLDVLSGGAGSDVFVFTGIVGNDTVLDFEDDSDLLDVSEFFENAEDAIAAATQSDLGTRIDLDDSTLNSVVLNGFSIEQLDSSDFLFA